MSKVKLKSKIIRQVIIDNLTEHPQDIAQLVVKKFGISRQAVNRHLNKLIDDGFITTSGKTKNRKYTLKPLAVKTFELTISLGLAEDVVWRERVMPTLNGIPKNVLDICQHGFTEMFNNVIAHSQSEKATVNIEYTPVKIKLDVIDRGVGIFNKIKTDLGLEDERHAILELSKGKLTTDPESHTGEGIFFTSRMFDHFAIISDLLFFNHYEPGDDWLLKDYGESYKGTRVIMEIHPESTRTRREVFDKYAIEKEDYGFTRTHVPVKLVKYGDENLVSRSQAKRLLARIDRFKEVFLDFRGVDMIGQAFADEIFRVYHNQNPNIELIWVNATEDVEKTIRRITTDDHKQLPLLE